MTEHTKLPWSLQDRWLMSPAGPVPLNGGYQDWVTAPNGPRYEEAQANAAFICKAVNNHEALVEAVRDFITILDEAQSGFIPGCGSDLAWKKGRDERVAAARLLLAVVGGSRE